MALFVKKNRDFLEWKERTNLNLVRPNNCLLNVVLSNDTKGVSTIHTLSIIEKACENWNEKIDSRFVTFDFRKSFTRISMFDDIYLRYIQFRSLHR